ncbi:MAG: tyrosine-type recombinase/integrase [Dehalococcoidia bacterium]|nr:tyrosine-type recombinase/integrase [Dehalococcoidia bacterium]
MVYGLLLGGDLLLDARGAGKGFLISLRASNRFSPRYLDGLEFSIALLADHAEAHGWPPVARLTTSHLEEYLAALQVRPRWFAEREKDKPRGLSQGTIETHYRRLRTFFGWLVRRGHIERNPFDLIPHPHIDEVDIPIVTERECRRLVQLVDPQLARTRIERFHLIRDRAALFLLLDTPGRRQELATLRTAAVDLDRGVVHVMGKGRRERGMPLGAAATQALWDYVQARAAIRPATDLLWTDERGRGLKETWLYLMVRRLGVRAGVPGLRPHRFRHTYATAALASEQMSERILEVIGGWRRIPQTYRRHVELAHAIPLHRKISPADKLTSSGEHTGVAMPRSTSAKPRRGRL